MATRTAGRSRPTTCALLLALSVLTAPLAWAPDWPTWRHDANRTGATDQELPDELHLQWVRHYPQLEPGWLSPINRHRMRYDRCYEPVVMGKTMFVGSSRNDSVRALDTETGAEKWVFYADGPVRFAPVAQRGRLYVVSDDGWLYCLDAETGEVAWRFLGGPTERKVLGNGRLISMWPARGAPVVVDDTVYWAASIWPFMGTFIYALDAETGEVVWENDGSGSIFIKQPHNSPSFGGVAPQGYLVAVGDRLLIPGGRSTPACYSRLTGELEYYNLAAEGKRGGSYVSAIGQVFFNSDYLYGLETGARLLPVRDEPVLTREAIYARSDEGVVALDLTSLRTVQVERKVTNRESGEEEVVKETRWVIDTLWTVPEKNVSVFIKAGSRLYAAKPNTLVAIDVPGPGGKPAVAWRANLEGTPASMLAADDRLFVVTLEGTIYCFGAEETQPQVWPRKAAPTSPKDRWSDEAAAIIETTGVSEGYCLAFGVGDGRLVEELARQSELQVVAVEPDEAKVARARKRLDAAGLYGTRVAVLHADPASLPLPRYLASLVVCEDVPGAGFAGDEAFTEKAFPSLRPYGGVSCVAEAEGRRQAFLRAVKEAGLAKAKVEASGRFVLLRREGGLPGSGDWTHQYGDVANTVVSKDRLVRLPLGILWFGGNSHMDVLPRHGHGPPEQIVGGRLFIEGLDCISARDVYTGRVLWKRELPELDTFGVYYDGTYKPNPLDTSYNQVHIPGANARGTNFVATEDRVYVIHGKGCLALDPATGETISEFKLPTPRDAAQPPEWAYLGVYQDLLIAGSGFVTYSDDYQPERPSYREDFDKTSSWRLVVMDRYSGTVLWTFESKFGLRHNAIAVGGDKVFCIDMMPSRVAEELEKAGTVPPGTPTLMALDVRTGKEVWSTTQNVFGTWLGYSQEHDVLIQAGRPSRDMLAYEPSKNVIAYRGADGKVLWNKEGGRSYSGPLMLHGDTILARGLAFDLLTGALKMRRNPLTGEETLWNFTRNYGCNYAIASEYLITFRSAAAGYFDLEHDGGTGNFGGFKSGCTSNLIAANGVLNAPDYTRTCTCSYQNQCSLALVHMPEVELWQETPIRDLSGRIGRVGINLGAPGDRKADDGTLWLEYPSVGGKSPEVTVEVQGESTYFRRHSSRVAGDDLTWVAASGSRGLTTLTLTLTGGESPPTDTRFYTVRLYFLEPEAVKPGGRVFDVALQGKTVIEDLDVVKRAGAPLTVHVEECKGVPVEDRLTVSLRPKAGSLPPVLCGLEVALTVEAALQP